MVSRMSLVPATPPKKLPVAKLIVGLLLLAGVAALLLRGLDYRYWIERLMELIRGYGPVAFFSAMALLPVVGMPMSLFTLTAGEVFAAQMTMTGVILATAGSVAISISLGYWLSRYAMRPLLLRILSRFGYSIPTVDRANALSIVLVLRLTPGPPFCFQNFLLGIAQVPFRLYFIVSWLSALPYIIAGVILGKGMLAGNFRFVAIGVGCVVVAAVIVQWLRRKYVKRET